ncbi:hypothetical protein M4D55_05180 [Metabacillus idriensis]|uniref:Uncharacterized protein n=1 Tax=Metabacillus idriensis TaxID=324768 RepID=A0A6I2M3W2_9BACI|nr:hypothetical protein [Metabacillus idriensis]MCM3595177.1 hypothetical protein [Metabacillus idriensis]MRX52795.1 hypothetical protein [Metabacillus idriensis]OHR74336.1 hypothetical protein HMPREF3291_18140 [Bacillus sp. HMSC76G11]
MSYVAPIQIDQYVQYANRMVRHKQDYAELSSVTRTQLNTRSAEEEKKFASMHGQAKRTKQVREMYFKKMTGNGRLFNESV